MKVDGNRRLGRFEWMTPEGHEGAATCVQLQWLRAHARNNRAALKCQLDVQLCAKNAPPAPRKEGASIRHGGQGEKGIGGVHRVTRGFRGRRVPSSGGNFLLRSEKKRGDRMNEDIAWSFLPQRSWRTVKEKFVFSSSLSREGEAKIEYRRRVEIADNWNLYMMLIGKKYKFKVLETKKNENEN